MFIYDNNVAITNNDVYKNMIMCDIMIIMIIMITRTLLIIIRLAELPGAGAQGPTVITSIHITICY